MERILKVQHWQPEFAYNDESFLAKRGCRTEQLLMFAGEPAPDPRRYDLVIVYGGYMSAFDDAANPWIAAEMRFLEACMESGTPVLGICLGSQLLARVLGARVFRSPAPEFGFKRLRLTGEGRSDPVLGAIGGSQGEFLAIQWHDDAWDLPSGARLLASSEAWPNQAFRYGSGTLATQFHLEYTQSHMAWAVARPDEPESADPEGEDRGAFAAPSPRYDAVRQSMESVLIGMLASSEAAPAAAAQDAVASSRPAR